MGQGKDKKNAEAQSDKELEILENEVSMDEDLGETDPELEALLNDNKQALDNANKVTESIKMSDKDAQNAYKQSAEEVKKVNKALNSMFSRYSPDNTVSKADMDELKKEVAAEKNKKPARNIKPSEKKESVRQGKKPQAQELSHAQKRELHKQKLQAQYGGLNNAAKQYGEKQLKNLDELKKNADSLQKKADAIRKQNAPKQAVKPQETQKQLDADKKKVAEEAKRKEEERKAEEKRKQEKEAKEKRKQEEKEAKEKRKQEEKEAKEKAAKEAKEKAAKEKADKEKTEREKKRLQEAAKRKAKQLQEEAKRKEEERKAEEKRKADEEAKRKKEEDKRKAKEEADRKAEEKRKAAEDAKHNKEIEKQKLKEQKLADEKKAQEDKEKKRQEELKKKEEDKRKAKEEADRKAEEKRKAAEDAKHNKEIEKQKLKEQKLADVEKAQEDKEKKRQEELKKKEEAKRNKEIEKQKAEEAKKTSQKKAPEAQKPTVAAPKTSTEAPKPAVKAPEKNVKAAEQVVDTAPKAPEQPQTADPLTAMWNDPNFDPTKTIKDVKKSDKPIEQALNELNDLQKNQHIEPKDNPPELDGDLKAAQPKAPGMETLNPKDPQYKEKRERANAFFEQPKAEQPKTEKPETKPVEAPKPTEAKPVEAPKPTEAKPVEAPKTTETKPVEEAPKATETKPVEAPKATEAKPVEAPKPTEAKPVEAPKPTEAKPVEAPKPTETKPVEAPKATEAAPKAPTAPKPTGKTAKGAEQMIEMADLSASSKKEPEPTQKAPEAPKAEPKTNGKKSVSLEEEWKKEAEAKAAKEQEKNRKQAEKEQKAAEKAALKVQKAAEKAALKVQKAAEKKAIKQQKDAIKQQKKDAKAAEKYQKKAAKAEEKRQQKELLEQKKAEGRARRAQDKADSKNLLYMKPPKMPNLLARMLRTPSARRFNQYSELLGMKPPSVLGTLLKGIGISALNIVGAVLGFKIRDRSNERFMEEFRERGNEFRQQNLRERAEKQYQQQRQNQMTPPQPRLQERQPMPNQLMQVFQNRQMQMMQRQFQAMARQIIAQQRQIEAFTRQMQAPRVPEIPKAEQPQVQSPQAQAPQMQRSQTQVQTQVQIPRVPEIPKAEQPQVQFQQAQVPQQQAPQMQRPQPQAPQAPQPQQQPQPQPQAPQPQQQPQPQMQRPQPQPQASQAQAPRQQMTPTQARMIGLQYERAQTSKKNPQDTTQGLMAARGYGNNFVQNPQFLKNLATFTAVSVINNGTPEDIKSFLKDPVGYTPKVQQMVASSQDQYVKNWTATQKDGDQLGHDYSFDDPKATSMAINKLAMVMNQEPNLGPAHVGAAFVGKHLLDALTDPKTNALNADDGLIINAAQYVNNALPTMAVVYRNGLDEELSFLSNPAKKENLGAVATKDAMNYVLDQNVQESMRNRALKNDQPTMAMQVMLSEQFNPQFLNAAMQSSNAAQTLMNGSAEEATNMLTNPNARGKLGENVAKEGFAAGAKYVARHQVKKDAEPKVETPQAEQPKVETPKAEAAQTEVKSAEEFLNSVENYFGKNDAIDALRNNPLKDTGIKMQDDVDDEFEPEVKEEPKPQEKEFDTEAADKTIGKHQPKDKPFEDILKDFEKQNLQPQADPNQPQATVPDLSSTKTEKSMAELGDDMQRQLYEQNKQFQNLKDTRPIDEQLAELNKKQAEQKIVPVEGPELTEEGSKAPGMETINPRRDPDAQKKLDAYMASLEQSKTEEVKEETKPEVTESSVQKDAVEADEKTLSSSLKQAEQGAAQKTEDDLRQKMADTVGKGNVTEEAQKNVSQLFEEKPKPQVETPKNEVKKEEPKPDTVSKGMEAQVNKVETKDNFKSILDTPDQLLGDMEKKFGADKITDQTRKNLEGLYQYAQKGERDINNQLNKNPDLSENWKINVNGDSVNSVFAYDNMVQQLRNGNVDALNQLSNSGPMELSANMADSQTARSYSQETHSPRSYAENFRNKDLLHVMSARAGEEVTAARMERAKHPNQISPQDATTQISSSTPNQKGADEFMKQVSDKFGAENITPDMRSNLTRLFNDNAISHNNLDKELGKNGKTARLGGNDVRNMLAFNQIASRIDKGDESVLNDMNQPGAASHLQNIMSVTNESKYFSDRDMEPNALDRAFNDPTQKTQIAQNSSAQIDNAFASKFKATAAQTDDLMLHSSTRKGALKISENSIKILGALYPTTAPGGDQNRAKQEIKNMTSDMNGNSPNRSSLNNVERSKTPSKNNPNKQNKPQQQQQQVMH